MMTQVEIDRLIEGARQLVEKIDAVHNDGRYQWVWQSAQLHGTPYEGPKYDGELAELRAILADIAVKVGGL